jgi:hypothetical protein
MRTLIPALLAFVCLLSIGCKGSSVDVTGKWKGTLDSKAAGSNPGADMAKQMLANTSLELKADHTFSMTMMLPFEGKWAQSGSKVTLTMTKAMGVDIETLKKQSGGKNTQDMDKPLELDVSSDGKSMTAHDPKGQGNDLIFTRG